MSSYPDRRGRDGLQRIEDERLKLARKPMRQRVLEHAAGGRQKDGVRVPVVAMLLVQGQAVEVIVGGASVGSLAARTASAYRRAETVSASIAEGRLGSALSIAVDGTTWTFDIPRIHLKGAREIAGCARARRLLIR